EQYCTGVVQTSSDVWLVAREELRSPLSKENTYVPDDAMDLSASLQVGSPDDLRYSPYARRYLTTLARLMEDGEFKVVATWPEVACLYATPETETLYLFPGLLQPEVETSDAANDPDAYYRRSRGQQEAVLRSTDRGQHWTWLQ